MNAVDQQIGMTHGTVEHTDGLVGLLDAGHGDERKAAAPLRDPIVHHLVRTPQKVKG